MSHQLVKPRAAHVKMTFLLHELGHILPLLHADIIQGGVPVPVLACNHYGVTMSSRSMHYTAVPLFSHFISNSTTTFLAGYSKAILFKPPPLSSIVNKSCPSAASMMRRVQTNTSATLDFFILLFLNNPDKNIQSHFNYSFGIITMEEQSVVVIMEALLTLIQDQLRQVTARTGFALRLQAHS